MYIIIDSNGRREVSQQEYDIYIKDISPSLEELKENMLAELEIITRKYISDNIYFEIEKSFRKSEILPIWVNIFVDSITDKNNDLKLQIKSCISIDELNTININSILN
tara:strand:- start:2708 stop:3031 length:324 start_codon:yes stop_codon:yes gene_type:complete